MCAARGHAPRVLFTSSVAVYGGTLPEVVRDDTALNPKSSYGTQKAIAELLLCDYSRRGFVDGRVLRLPTISVRPGRPNAAASSFASGIIREPLNGERAVCPVGGDVRLWLLSPKQAIESLIAGCELEQAELGTWPVVNMPGLSVSVTEMVDALKEVAGEDVAALIDWQPDPKIEKIVGSWPGAWETERGESWGWRRTATSAMSFARSLTKSKLNAHDGRAFAAALDAPVNRPLKFQPIPHAVDRNNGFAVGTHDLQFARRFLM